MKTRTSPRSETSPKAGLILQMLRSETLLRGVACALAVLGLVAVQPARASPAIWNGTTNALWATGTNWSTTPVPGTGDTATFNNAGGAVDTIDLGTGVTINTILFDTSSAAAYTIGSVNTQTLTLNNGGAITVNSGVTATQTIGADIVLGTDGSTQNFTLTNNRPLSSTVGLQIQQGPNVTITGSSGAGVKSIIIDGVGHTSVLANIGDGTGGGTVALVKNGSGVLVLGYSGSANTYTGGTYLNGGALHIGPNNGNIKSGTALYIAGGTTLNAVNSSGVTLTNIAQQWNGDFTFGGTNAVNPSLQQMTFSGGTVNLGATGTDTTRTVTTAASTLTINGVISNGTNGTTKGLTKAGAGTMALSGANLYTGTTTVSGGILLAKKAAALPNYTTQTISVNTSGAVLAVNAGAGSPTEWSDTEIANLLANANVTFVAGTSFGIDTTSGNFTYGTAITKANMGLTKLGTNALTLSGANTFSGGVTLSAGTLNINNAGALGTGTFTISGGTIDNTSGGAITNSNNNAIALNANFTFTGANALNLGTGAVTMGGTAGEKAITVSAGTLTIGGAISSTGTSWIAKAGAGTLVLTGTSSFGPPSGNEGFRLDQGTVSVSSINNAGANGNLGIADKIAMGYDQASGNPTLLYTGTGETTDRGFKLRTKNAAATMTIDQSGTNLLKFTGTVTGTTGAVVHNLILQGSTTGSGELGGVISNGTGTTAITKAGTNTWTLSGINTYTGTTTVNGGTLLLDMSNGSGALSSSSALTLGGGTFSVKGKTSGTTAQTLASLSLTAGTASAVKLVANGGTRTTLTITNATVNTGAGASVNFNYYDGGTGTTNGSTIGNDIVAWSPTLTAAGIIGGAYTVTDAGGTGFATVSSGNVVRLADPGSAGLPLTGGGTNSYFVNSTYSTTDTGTAGSLVEALSGPVAANTVTVDTTGLASGANLALGANTLTLTTGGGMWFSGANPYTIDFSGAGGITGSAATSAITLNNYNTSPSGVTINAPILNTATALSVTFVGPGTTVLNGPSTYSGATNVYGTTLQLGSAGATGTSAITVNSGLTLQLRNDNNTSFATGGITSTLSGTAMTIDVNNAASAVTGKTLTLSALSFNQNGVSKTLNVTGGNSYGLTITALNDALGVSSGAITVNLNATTAPLSIGTYTTDGWDSTTLLLSGGNNISIGTYRLTSNGNHTLTVGGAVVTLGTTYYNSTYGTRANNAISAYNLNSGTLNLTSSTSLANASSQGGPSAPTFTINGGTLDNTSGATLTLAGATNIAGIPTITIGGDFAFTGGTGTSHDLNLGNGATNLGTTAGTSRTITANAGTLTLGGIIGNGTTANSIIKAGAGTLTLSGANTFNGGLNIRAGTVKLGATAGAGAGTVTLGVAGDATSGTLDLNGASRTIIGLATAGTAANQIIGNSSTTAATLNYTGATTSTFGGVIQNVIGSGSSTTAVTVNNASANLTLSGANTYSGATTVSGGTLKFTTGGSLNNATITVGGTSGPTLDITGGSVTASGTTMLGKDASNPGYLTLGPGGSLTLNGQFIVGDYAVGQFTQTGGIFNSTNAFYVSNHSAPGSSIDVSGGTFTAGTLILGVRDNASLTVRGDATVTLGTLQHGWISGTSTSTVDLNGGSLIAGTITQSLGTGNFNFNGGTLKPSAASTTFMTGLTRANVRNGGAVIDTGAYAITIGQALLHSNIGGDNAVDGGLTKLGSNTLTLSGANAYSGNTTVSKGTLKLTGTGSINSSPVIDVASLGIFDVAGVTGGYTLGASQTLQGNGTVIGPMTAAGTVAPGSSTGVLTVTGNATLNGTFSVEVETDGDSDRLDVTGNLALGPASVLSIVDIDQLLYGLPYTIATYGTQSGTFAGGTNLPVGWSVEYGPQSSSGAITLTPEPATMALLGLGGLGLILSRKRK